MRKIQQIIKEDDLCLFRAKQVQLEERMEEGQTPTGYISCARWRDGLISFSYTGHDNTTRDRHDTMELAEGVCAELRKEGFGGGGIEFPIQTWIETEWSDTGKDEPGLPIYTGWRIPSRVNEFGDMLQLDIYGGLWQIMYRGRSGWRSCEDPGMARARLPHQFYKNDFKKIIKEYGLLEICAVDLTRGIWITIWADSESEITYDCSHTHSRFPVWRSIKKLPPEKPEEDEWDERCVVVWQDNDNPADVGMELATLAQIRDGDFNCDRYGHPVFRSLMDHPGFPEQG